MSGWRVNKNIVNVHKAPVGSASVDDRIRI